MIDSETFPTAQENSQTPKPENKVSVGLLVWAAVLLIVGLVTVLVPALGLPSFQGVVVSMFSVMGLAFLGLALYAAKRP